MEATGSWVSVSLQLSKFTKHTAKRDQVNISFNLISHITWAARQHLT